MSLTDTLAEAAQLESFDLRRARAERALHTIGEDTYSCIEIGTADYSRFAQQRLQSRTVGSFLFLQNLVSLDDEKGSKSVFSDLGFIRLYRLAIVREYLARLDWEERHGIRVL